jgi:hypothetical protein
MSASYDLLQQVHQLGVRLTELLATHLAAPIDPASALTTELNSIDGALNAIQQAFRPLILVVSSNPAYRSYRAVANEDRQLNKPLKAKQPK